MIFKSGRQTRPRQADRQTHTHIHTHTNSQRERSSKYFIKMNKKCKHQSLCLCAASGSDCADCSGTVNDLTTEQRGSWTRVRACVSFNLNYTYCKNVHVTTHTLGSIFDHSSHLCMCVCVCVFSEGISPLWNHWDWFLTRITGFYWVCAYQVVSTSVAKWIKNE